MLQEQKHTCSTSWGKSPCACAVGEVRATVGALDRAAASENWLWDAHPLDPSLNCFLLGHRFRASAGELTASPHWPVPALQELHLERS